MAKRSHKGNGGIVKVYFAGKVDNYREELFGHRIMSRGEITIPIAGIGDVTYAGPSAIACDHRCFHGNMQHGLISVEGGCESGFLGKSDVDALDRAGVVKRCLRQIDGADVFYAWLGREDCYGTLVEMGFASAAGVPIIVDVSPEIALVEGGELWFALNLPGVSAFLSNKPMSDRSKKNILKIKRRVEEPPTLVLNDMKHMQ